MQGRVNSRQERSQGHNAGFTLIEISIVIIIFGLIVAAFFPLYQLYKKNAATEETRANLEEINNAIGSFRVKYGRYPCPATPQLARNNPQYGREAGECDTPAIGAGSCNGNGLCVYQSARASDSGYEVVVGTIPFRQLNLDEDYQIDGYYNRYTYAVTRGQTNVNTFEEGEGGIDYQDNGGDSVLATPDTGDFIILSHGANGYGAYTADGGRIPCNTNGPERQNCVPESGNNVFSVAQYSENAATSYDDVVSQKLLADVQYYSYSDSSNNAAQDDVMLRKDGNVNINSTSADNPGKKLFTKTGIVRAREKMEIGELCTSDDSACFRPELIGGRVSEDGGGDEGIKCPSGQYLLAIENGEAVCSDEYIVQCEDPDEFVRGINPDGTLDCNEPPGTCPLTEVSICKGYPKVEIPEKRYGQYHEVESGHSRKETWHCNGSKGKWEEAGWKDSSGVCDCTPGTETKKEKNCPGCALPGSTITYEITTSCDPYSRKVEEIDRDCRCQPEYSEEYGTNIDCYKESTKNCPEGYEGSITKKRYRECSPDGDDGILGRLIRLPQEGGCTCINGSEKTRTIKCGKPYFKEDYEFEQTRRLDCSDGSWSSWSPKRSEVCSCSYETRSGPEITRSCPKGYKGDILVEQERGPDIGCSWRHKQDLENRCETIPPSEKKWDTSTARRVPGSGSDIGGSPVGDQPGADCTLGKTGICYRSKGGEWWQWTGCECRRIGG